jgi:capsular polysaccharide biosynthesis protein
MPNDVVMLLSQTVAERAMKNLGLSGADNLVGTYTAKQITDRVLTLTVSAPSSGEAARRANALAGAFLRFRAEQLQAQQDQVFSALNLQIAQSQQQIASLASQIASISGQAATPSQQAQLKKLKAQHDQAGSVLTQLQQSTNAYRVTSQQATASIVAGSQVLDPATPLRRGTIKHTGLYAVVGLIAGLALGLVVVIVMELASDRMRWREDVARALGAPVRLSVRSVPGSRRPAVRRRAADARADDMRRLVAHLRASVPSGSRGMACLAVVAVDNAQAAALPLVSLAVSCAQDGRKVVLADLSGGASAARLAGAGEPGLHTVEVDGARLVVAVPDDDEVVPAGPVRHRSARARLGEDGSPLADACASADLLLTLVTLDPALGADHLPTWAADAVVVVTAGQSSWAKLHAVGEMVRPTGTRLASAILLGADNTDESLGATPTSPDNVMGFPS